MRTRLGERKAFVLLHVKTDGKSLVQNCPAGRLTCRIEVKCPKTHPSRQPGVWSGASIAGRRGWGGWRMDCLVHGTETVI